MDIKMNDKSGVTLKTAGKYCTEDIVVTPNFEIGITPTGSIEITENGTYDVTDKASAVVNVAGSGGAEIVTKYGYSGTTPVPNTGTISNIYFNTALSTEEVKTTIAGAGLTFFDFDGISAYAIAVPTVDGQPVSALVMVDYFPMTGETNAFVIIDMFAEAMYFVGSELLGAQLGFTGWNPELVASGGVIAVTGELISSMADMGIPSIGTQNNAISSVVSGAEYTKGAVETITLTGEYDGTEALDITENGTTDIATLLNEKKLPLKVNVEIPIPNLLADRVTNSLTQITAKDIEGINGISDYAFYYCTALTSIEIPDSVTFIGGYSFYNCTGLTSVDIGNSVTSIGEYAFYYCNALASIEIPNSVTSIGTYAFYRCSKLTSIVIPDSVTSIGEYVFNNCLKLTSVVIGNGVTKISSNAFSFCYDLASVVIGNSVTWIDTDAFRMCESLASVVIPNSVTAISPYAFYGCESLASVVIGSGVTTIRSQTFYGCSACLLYNFSTHTAVPTLDNTNAFYNINTNCKIVVPDSLYDTWIAATNWSTYASYIVKASEYTA